MVDLILQLEDIVLGNLPWTKEFCAQAITLVEHLSHAGELVLRCKVHLLDIVHALSTFRDECPLLDLFVDRTPVQTLAAPCTCVDLHELRCRESLSCK